ncbi:hypothetical protein ABW20_dc0106962 [Dactylellina cionopaga]|nr:hypothetical protein ABW20_dc0106962 [Dactylellina cionopaga]
MAESATYKLILARHSRGNRPRTKQLAEDTFLMLLPPGYEMNNKLKLKGNILPHGGQFIVSYMTNPKQTDELLELIRLRSCSPLVNAIAPADRRIPPSYDDHVGNLKFVDDILDEESEDNAGGYRCVISHMHSIFTTALTKYINAEPSDERIYGMPYLETLGRSSPIWEERAKKLLLEEQKVLQELVKEVKGGINFIHFHISRMVKVCHFEKLVMAAMMDAIARSPIVRAYHMIAYDVNIERYVHGIPGEALLPQLGSWIKSPNSTDTDSFRINSHYVTQTQKHPMQCLDDLGEKFFRKLIDTFQSGEVLYTRAVLCRSLLITYFFQSFISVWDDCLLNGHLESMKGVIPAYPKIHDRLRETMTRGSCPRESHPEMKTISKLLIDAYGEEEAIITTSRPAISSSVDVEMVDAGPLSDRSSATIIQDEDSSLQQVRKTSSKKSKKAKKAQKRRQAKRDLAMGDSGKFLKTPREEVS